MFDLVVEMTTEPVVEERALDVAGGSQLHAHPVVCLLVVHLARQVAHLGRPHKPVALQEPAGQRSRVRSYKSQLFDRGIKLKKWHLSGGWFQLPGSNDKL